MKQRSAPPPVVPVVIEEDPDYLSRQLITCLGNKRAMLKPISQAVQRVQQALGREKLRVFDAFSGSGVVSRWLKGHASYLACNDLEDYASVISRCYLTDRNTVDWNGLASVVAELNREALRPTKQVGFLEELYAPRNEQRITWTDRVFYTRDNARRLDCYRQLIDTVPAYRELLLGPLLSKASIHANTAGVFKGFYKNRTTRIGQYGGSGADALTRIKGQITLEVPILSRHHAEVEVFQGDTNIIAPSLKKLDLVYLDPPYNQHPYGSNYFMLNLLVRYQRPEVISPVSGIPTTWNRSGYNNRQQSLPLLRSLLESLDTRYALISFNNEGFISPTAMLEMLKQLGQVETLEIPYTTFRGSRNLENRSIQVTERLFLLRYR